VSLDNPIILIGLGTETLVYVTPVQQPCRFRAWIQGRRCKRKPGLLQP